jgi:hypothetical protein
MSEIDFYRIENKEKGTISNIYFFTSDLKTRLNSRDFPTKKNFHLVGQCIPYSDHYLNKLIYSNQNYSFRFNSLNNVFGDYSSFSVDGKMNVQIKNLIKETVYTLLQPT